MESLNKALGIAMLAILLAILGGLLAPLLR